MKPIINEFQFEYTIDYDKPISVTEFTNSLNAISNGYEKFLIDKYGSERPEAELFVQEIKKGSIVTTLVECSAMILPFLGDVNTVVEFGKFIKSGYDFLLTGKKTDDFKDLDIKDLSNFQKIIEPGTHNNNNIIIKVKGKNNRVILNPLSVNENESRIIRDRIRSEKKELTQKDKSIKTNQALYLDQIKRDLDSKKGNRGVIKELNENSLNLIWENESEKQEMLNCDDNPLKMIFIVDVEIVEVNSETKLYKILKLHEIIEP
ncbi:hypothetical protein [Empedobacter tilapiae]|uniref:Uncharacterized protein n=1 Tax=Empedobacter tilapiae TaxID=2491114 RepID=A0A4Z1BBP1_9FLAO|nr:hypothetical protein [Empedobacter tilapiae]TGN22540.1 hypothetical protein E4J94_15965 [Empedobacter tilapiae]